MGKLTASELKRYDAEARELVLRMIDDGWSGRISSRGHAILRAPDGKSTASVSPNYHRSRAGKNAEAVYRRWKSRK